MPIASRLQTTAVQSAQAGAANGAAANIERAQTVVAEVSGTFTNITVNWEGSIDGSTFFGIGLAPLTTRVYAATATATGLYLLQDAGPLTHIRARTTVSGPTGSITVKVRAETA